MNDISETLKYNRENKKRLTINQALDYLFKVVGAVVVSGSG